MFEIELTFTAISCPAMEMIQDDIRERLLNGPRGDEVAIEITLGPGIELGRRSARTRARRCAGSGSSHERRTLRVACEFGWRRTRDQEVLT